MLEVFSKEITLFFSSVAAYVSIGIFLIILGLLLWAFPDSAILDYGYAGLNGLFDIAPYIFMFLIPAITMKSFAEEKKEGTLELLMTRPVSEWQLVCGKFLACVFILLIALLPTLLYYYTVYQLGLEKGNIDTGAVIGSYIGLLLLGSGFIASGIFASSITSSQITAFLITAFISYIAYSGLNFSGQLLFNSGNDVMGFFSIYNHYQSMSRGVLDTRDLVYFFSYILFFLILSKLVIGGRR